MKIKELQLTMKNIKKVEWEMNGLLKTSWLSYLAQRHFSHNGDGERWTLEDDFFGKLDNKDEQDCIVIKYWGASIVLVLLLIEKWTIPNTEQY